MNVNLKSLVGRLNDVSRNALESAAGLCLSRTNYDVEIEHILAKLLEQDDTDLHKICNHYEVNIDRLSKDVSSALDRLKSGNSRTDAGAAGQRQFRKDSERDLQRIQPHLG
jgi:type VI secretion system protein VasG